MRCARVGLILLGALAGCAQLDPAGAAPTPVRVEGPPIGERVDVQPWWQQLSDPQLQRLIGQAMAGSPDAEQAQARLAQARAGLALAQANSRPQLNLQSAVERQRQSGRVADDPTQPISSRYTVDAQVAWQLDLVGRNAQAQQAAQSLLQAAEHDASGARAALVASVVQQYSELALAEAEAVLAAQALELTQAQARTQAQLLAAGRSTRQAADAEAVNLAQAEQQLRATQHRRRQAVAQLALLCGAQATAFDLSPAAADLLAQAPRPMAQLPAAVVAQRADVQAAWQRWLASSHESERTRLERFPSLTLTSGAGWLSDSFRRWLSSGSSTWLLGVRASLPLLDGGRLRAGAAQAQAQADGLGADYRRTVLLALQETAQALSQQQLADEQVQLSTHRLEQTQRRTQDAQALLQSGRGSRPQLHEAQLQQAQADTELRRAQAQRLQAAAQLSRALGQGA